jgi:hypothetical protein
MDIIGKFHFFVEKDTLSSGGNTGNQSQKKCTVNIAQGAGCT